jgi:dipeptidyl aminopeptidase/acylaminoacyl peptidase
MLHLFVNNVVSAFPRISADGRFVAFVAGEREFFEGAAALPMGGVFLRDTQTNRTSLVSAKDGDTAPDVLTSGDEQTISADGRYVAFVSYASNLVPGIGENRYHVYRRDTHTNRTVLVSAADGSTTPGNEASSQASISPDGRYVAFWSYADNLIEGVRGAQVYLRDVEEQRTILVSAADGSATIAGDNDRNYVYDDRIARPSVSADGRFVAFGTRATKLVRGVTGIQVYLRDTQTNRTSLISAAHGSMTPGNGPSHSPHISADGSAVAFISTASNLVPGVSGEQVYVRVLNAP